MKNTVHYPTGMVNGLKRLSEPAAKPERPAKLKLQKPPQPKTNGYQKQ